MGNLAKEFAKAFADGCKIGPRIFFAPIAGAMFGAMYAIKKEINRPASKSEISSDDVPENYEHCNQERKKAS